MKNSEYLDLILRREKYGKNVGALDFLIKFGEKKRFLSSSNCVYESPVSVSHKYKRLEDLNHGVGRNPRANEFGYLVDYANILRNVQMTQTFLGQVRYLITKIHALDSHKKNELLKLIRAAYIVSGDVAFFEALEGVDSPSVGKISLPKSIVDNLPSPFNKRVRKGTAIHDRVFTIQNELAEIDKILEEEEHLLAEQTQGLKINQARLVGNESAYLDAINDLLTSSKLSPITSIDLAADNVLASIKHTAEHVKPEDRGLVTIIMSCFNSEGTVGYALESLLAQTYENLEILICDDSSDDASLQKIIQIAKRDRRVKVFRSKDNQGTYNIRNALLERAAGEFITFQDSDDWAHPQRIEEQVSYLTTNNVPVVSARWVRIDPRGNAIFFVDGRILRFCVVSTMVKRFVFSIVPKFRPSLVAADTEFHEACIKFLGEEKVKVLEKPLILGLWGDGSLTKKDGLQAESNGQVALRRRNYSDIAARQRVLGSRIVTDNDVEEVLKENGIYRDYKGVVEVEVGR
ncbi:glycosyltransferase family 2 protein [Marinobacter sp. W-8]|uniref:glycosyltransferase family 2 protein n=1 Tax=Marinobacter sp. W-8 TaxID=3369658 RepID=UPI0037C5E98B